METMVIFGRHTHLDFQFFKIRARRIDLKLSARPWQSRRGSYEIVHRTDLEYLHLMNIRHRVSSICDCLFLAHCFLKEDNINGDLLDL